MAHRRFTLRRACLLISLAISTAAFATASPERTQIGHNINVGPDEEVGELTCIGCSIYIRGQVAGEATAVGGSVYIEGNAQVAGDVTVVAGDVRLDKDVKVAGEVTLVGGEFHRDPQASISGNVTTVGGRGWIVPILLVPFVILGLIIAFIVWLVQRIRRPSLPPVPA
jgi:hypothetical protein